jgi:hypothetical protein
MTHANVRSTNTHAPLPNTKVYKAVNSTSPLVLTYATESDLLQLHFPRAKGLHGGPPVVFIPASPTTANDSYYLGIVHFKKFRKDGLLYYPHYFYKTQPHPPFKIVQVATRRLPLQVRLWCPRTRLAAACSMTPRPDALLRLNSACSIRYQMSIADAAA